MKIGREKTVTGMQKNKKSETAARHTACVGELENPAVSTMRWECLWNFQGISNKFRDDFTTSNAGCTFHQVLASEQTLSLPLPPKRVELQVEHHNYEAPGENVLDLWSLGFPKGILQRAGWRALDSNIYYVHIYINIFISICIDRNRYVYIYIYTERRYMSVYNMYIYICKWMLYNELTNFKTWQVI